MRLWTPFVLALALAACTPAKPPAELHGSVAKLQINDTAPGTGAVETFTINHQAWAPGLEVPFVIARVRLDGVPGVYITSNIVGCAVEDVHFDDPVRVVFEQQDDIFYPLFEKVS